MGSFISPSTGSKVTSFDSFFEYAVCCWGLAIYNPNLAPAIVTFDGFTDQSGGNQPPSAINWKARSRFTIVGYFEGISFERLSAATRFRTHR
jgi:hypothetical protein